MSSYYIKTPHLNSANPDYSTFKMSRHQAVKNMDLDEEMDIADGDYDDHEETEGSSYLRRD